MAQTATVPTVTYTHAQILDLLRAWVAQRPGLRWEDYGGDTSAYNGDARPIRRAKRDALVLIGAVAMLDLSETQWREAFRAFSGRLSLRTDKPELEYCTGQYWPTEYRNAACAVLASALWDHVREHMPAPELNTKIIRTHGPFKSSHDSIEGLTPGDWMRRHFRQRFGAGITRRWFN